MDSHIKRNQSKSNGYQKSTCGTVHPTPYLV